MYLYVLAVHIVGALVLLFFCVRSFISPQKHMILTLSLSTLFVVVSGSVLSILTSASLVAYCARLGLYALVVVSAQVNLIIRTRPKWSGGLKGLNYLSLSIIIATSALLIV